ncbi:hypothetical protein L9F63_002419, partial [Diploptera punctata]
IFPIRICNPWNPVVIKKVDRKLNQAIGKTQAPYRYQANKLFSSPRKLVYTYNMYPYV